MWARIKVKKYGRYPYIKKRKDCARKKAKEITSISQPIRRGRGMMSRQGNICSAALRISIKKSKTRELLPPRVGRIVTSNKGKAKM